MRHLDRHTNADVFVYQLAEKLHMSPRQVMQSHSFADIQGWQYYFEWQHYEHEREKLHRQTSQEAQSKARNSLM